MNNDISPTPPKNAVPEEIPIPPEILDLRQKERRFRILAPILVVSIITSFFIIIPLVNGEWRTLGLVLLIAIPIITLLYFSGIGPRKREYMIKDIVNRRK